MADPSYKLQIKQSLTIKPKDFHIRVSPRARTSTGSTRVPSGVPAASLSAAPQTSPHESVNAVASAATAATIRLYVLYGSNTGTSESFAQKIASNALQHGMPLN